MTDEKQMAVALREELMPVNDTVDHFFAEYELLPFKGSLKLFLDF